MLKELMSGVVGAVAVTAVHESARLAVPHAPRMDVIGTRAISRPMRAAGKTPPRWNQLHRYALAGDILSNSLYYSLVGLGPKRNVMQRGLILGLAAGVGAALLPPVLGLGRQPHRLSPMTELLTIAWYTIGGVAAARALKRFEQEPDPNWFERLWR